jgi:steroid 5-alpha reductase family enzyme
MNKSRVYSFVLIVIIYAIAFTVAISCCRLFNVTPLLHLFFADMVATLIVWVFGVIFKNSSVYDPYWSVAPLVIVLTWLQIRGGQLSFMDALIIAAIFIWGIRLTLNWAVGFRGLHYQDWRYTMHREQNPKLWFLINLLGINVMPTLLVFGGMIPVYFGVMSRSEPGIVSMAGCFICLIATIIQFLADGQLARFKKNNTDDSMCINEGIWKYSRHPNYLGEILFWWGIFIVQMGVRPQYWFTGFGAMAITLLFVFISIPMMEKHVAEKRPIYAEYKQRVPMLIPWKPKI